MLWHFISPSKIAGLVFITCIPLLAFFMLIFVYSNTALVVELDFMYVGAFNLYGFLLFDSLSISFSLVVMVISFSVMLFAMSYMSGDKTLKYFTGMVILFVISMNLLIYSPHMLSMLLGWDGLGLISYLLVIYYMNDKSLGAGMITALSNRVGDAVLILGVSYSFLGGHWSFVLSGYGSGSFLLLMLIIASLTKSAQLPFSAWLPSAMAAPTPVSALVHSSTLVTAGVYVLIRFYPTLSIYEYFNFLMLFLGVTTCMMASLAGIFEVDLKKIVALSTLSQLGVMVMSIGLGQPGLAFFHLLTHALFKALLFICVGTVIHSMGDNQDIRLMGNIGVSMPLTAMTMNVANLSLCGLPFLAGFYSKDSIMEIFMMEGTLPMFGGLMLIFSVCLTSAYTIRLSLITLWSPFKGVSLVSLTDDSKTTRVSYFILVSGAIMSGAIFSWVFMPNLSPMVLPSLIKMIILTFLTVFGTFMYLILNNHLVFSGSYFMTSMWFLSYISSLFVGGVAFKFNYLIYFNEMTWMETFGGAGGLKVLLSSTKYAQKLTNLSFSKLMTVMVVNLLVMVLLFSPVSQ